MDTRELEAHHRILRRFVEVYCRDHHGGARVPCQECAELIAYARKKLDRCPQDPKPKCKECPTPCYGREQRERIRAVMRYSGMYFVKRGRLDWLVRYFLIEVLPGLRRGGWSGRGRGRLTPPPL